VVDDALTGELRPTGLGRLRPQQPRGQGLQVGEVGRQLAAGLDERDRLLALLKFLAPITTPSAWKELVM